MDQVLADEAFAATGQSDEVFWQLADHQGTIRDVAYDVATLAKHVEIDSFGQLGAVSYYSGGPAYFDQRFYYSGQEWDEWLRLHNYNARWYDSAIGRFLSEDPSGFDVSAGLLERYRNQLPDRPTFAELDELAAQVPGGAGRPRSPSVKDRTCPGTDSPPLVAPRPLSVIHPSSPALCPSRWQ